MKKVLLIFGAAGALGKGVTDILTDKDYDEIYLFDSKVDELNYSDNKIKKVKISDLSNEKNVAKAFKDIKSDKGTSFFLFSTVGGFFGGKTIWETELSDWDEMFNKNLKTNFLLAKYFSGIVKYSAGGSICFTAALTGLEAETKKGAYGASKSALVHLVKTLALEGKSIRLSANAIAPYIIDTYNNRKWMKDSDFDTWIKPREIGQVIHNIFENFFFITGNIIKFTGRF